MLMQKKPEIVCFAGPNGSGKSTITKILECSEDFSFETVLSTDRNLDLLKRAKEKGYFIRCIFVLTANPQINVERVQGRVEAGGHDVPTDKIVSRYYKSLAMIKKLKTICDRLNVYDNSREEIERIYKKRNDEEFLWENEFWTVEQINQLL